MYGYIKLDEVKSYASESNAMRAVEKAFGKHADGQRREFNVLLTYNSAGRVVPVICNVSKDINLGQFAHAGFMVVN